MPTAIVTGANRGIGNAFCHLLCKEGYKVHACDRELGEPIKSLPKEATSHELDVTSPESIEAFRKSIEDEPIDLLLNIAGIMAPPTSDSLTTTNFQTLSRTFAVNTYGPLLLTQSLLSNLLASTAAPPKLAIISSRVGSIADNSSGGSYAYRASKAAVNSIGKSLSVDLKSKGVLVMLLHPGFVKSDMTKGLTMPPETVEPEEAAEKLWQNVVNNSKIGMEQTGRFWHREGFELPW